MTAREAVDLGERVVNGPDIEIPPLKKAAMWQKPHT